MSDKTASVWSDIWAKAKAAYLWCASWVAEYSTIALAVMILLAIAALV